MCGSQRVNPVSAADTVRADGNRISGSGSMSRVTRSDTSAGTSGRTRRTGTGVVVNRRCRSCTGLPVSGYGSRPVSAQYRVAPRLNRSARLSTSCGSRACSGAMYPMVPSTTPGSVICWVGSRASPKSSTFACPSGVMRMFDGLMSRWTRPCRWASPRASATWRNRSHARRAESGPRSRTRVNRSWPGISSITK